MLSCQRRYCCLMLCVFYVFSFGQVLSAGGTNQAQPTVTATKKKALLAVFGVASRSTRHTWPQVKKMIVAPLQADYDVDLYVFNNQLDNVATLDGYPVQKSGRDLFDGVDSVTYHEMSQSQIDIELAQKYPRNTLLPGLYRLPKPRFFSWSQKHQDRNYRTAHNAMRQFYAEQTVSDYLSQTTSQYDLVVAITADLYPLLALDMDQIHAYLAQDESVILLSPQNNSGAKYNKKLREFTNGYYVGSQNSVAKVMGTLKAAPFNNIDPRLYLSYENALGLTIRYHCLLPIDVDLYFAKMRNSGICTYTGQCVLGKGCRNGLVSHVYGNLDLKKQALVKTELSALKLNMPSLSFENVPWFLGSFFGHQYWLQNLCNLLF